MAAAPLSTSVGIAKPTGISTASAAIATMCEKGGGHQHGGDHGGYMETGQPMGNIEAPL
jgi:hypothetical protein